MRIEISDGIQILNRNWLPFRNSVHGLTETLLNSQNPYLKDDKILQSRWVATEESVRQSC